VFDKRDHRDVQTKDGDQAESERQVSPLVSRYFSAKERMKKRFSPQWSGYPQKEKKKEKKRKGGKEEEFKTHSHRSN
jgi:hypothetical protein